MGESQVPFLTGWLFLSVKSFWNKSWARPVPAAAVTPAALVVAVFIGPKAFVLLVILLNLRSGEVSGTPRVEVKFCNPGRTTCGEGG